MAKYNIRNFCIIAHIDHGKSTLADRMLQITHTVSEREMHSQFLDKIEIERERGITIKLQAVRMHYQPEKSDQTYILNLIDTPGHIDFSYEVNRSLAACEGALLLIDATQGIQAQTLANFFKAKDAGLKIIPVVNKIDLPAAHPEEVAIDVIRTFGFSQDEVIFSSAKTGEGVTEILEAIIEHIPCPSVQNELLQALVFDSYYDQHKGVVAVVRIVNGTLKKEDLKLINARQKFEPIEIGYLTSRFEKTEQIEPGEVGYVATGLKNIQKVRVGDTITNFNPTGSSSALPGYQEPKPMVYANLYPEDPDQAKDLRVAVEKYNLTDGAFTFDPVKSNILGSGFRCGFLGLLHLEIVRERIETEFNIPTQITAPTVEYQVRLRSGEEVLVKSTDELPEPNHVEVIKEPWCKVLLFGLSENLGPLMKITEERRAIFVNLQHLGDRIEVEYEMPLSEIISDYFDQVKSASSGYASMDYEIIDYRPVELVRIEVLLNKDPYPELSKLVVSQIAEAVGHKLVNQLKDNLPKQQFNLPIQAAIGGKVIARETLSAMRKDVTAKLYGGDRTRKDKLLKKQAKGKKRMQQFGKIRIPSEVYRKILVN